MNIAIVNDKFSNLSGGQHRIQNIGKGLKLLGHRTIYIAPYGTSITLDELFIEQRHRVLQTLLARKQLSAANDALFTPLALSLQLLKMLKRFTNGLDALIIALPSLFKLMSLYLVRKLIEEGNLSIRPGVVLDFGDIWWKYTYAFTKMIRNDNKNLLDILAYTYTEAEETIGLKLFQNIKNNLKNYIVTVPTSLMKNFFSEKGFKNVFFIPHPVDTYASIANSRLDMIGVFVRIYTDEVQMYLEEIIDKLAGRGLRVFLFVSSYSKHIWKKILGKLNNVILMPPMKRNNFLKLAKEFAIAFIIEPSTIGRLSLVPRNIAKTADLLSMGVPVLTNSLALHDYVINDITGYLHKSVDMLVEEAATLLKQPDRIAKLKQSTIDFAKNNLYCAKVAENILKLLNNARSNT